MRDFNRKKRFGRNGPERSGRRTFERFDREDTREKFGRGDSERIMHDATCDKCGKRCKLPFRPSGGKPVYCSECFKRNEYMESRAKVPSPSMELEEINLKLDKILKALNIR